MSETKALVRNTLLLFTSDIIVNVLAILQIIIITHFIGDESFGKYSFVLAFVGLFSLLSDLGIGQLIIKKIARNKKETQKFFQNALGLKVILIAITFIAPIVGIMIIQKSAEITLLVALASLSMIFMYMSNFLRWFLQAHEIMQYEPFIRFIEKVFSISLIVVALILGYGLIGLFIALCIAYCLSTIIASTIVIVKITRIKFSFNLAEWIKIVKEGFPFFLGGVFSLIYFRIDTVMLTYMQNFSVVGWYNAAFRLVEGLSFLPLIFITVTFPVMSRLYAQNKEHLRLLIGQSVRYLLILAIPLGVGTTLIADRIISYVYPPQFEPAVSALQILIWAEVVLFINLVLGYSLNAVNKEKKFTFTAGICAVFNIIVNAFLIPLYSYNGAAIATVATQIVSFSLLYLFLTKPYRFQLNVFIKPIIASLFMGFALWWFRDIAIWWSVPIAAIIYFSCLLAIKGIGRQDFDLIKHLIPKRFLGSPQLEE